VTRPTTRARLVEAAFAVVDERGWESTTADDIAARAGVSRTTFFRTFSSKTEVVFPDHDSILSAVRQRLADPGGDPVEAAAGAASLVLRHYVAEGQLARSRYALTSTAPALRDREVTSASRYQRAFYKHFARTAADPLDAELQAAAVVTVHNQVLRLWLQERCASPEAELLSTLTSVLTRLQPSGEAAGPSGAVVILRTSRHVEALLPALRALLDDAAEQ
jgi:AcrR family transcriptional regulator